METQVTILKRNKFYQVKWFRFFLSKTNIFQKINVIRRWHCDSKNILDQSGPGSNGSEIVFYSGQSNCTKDAPLETSYTLKTIFEAALCLCIECDRCIPSPANWENDILHYYILILHYYINLYYTIVYIFIYIYIYIYIMLSYTYFTQLYILISTYITLLYIYIYIYIYIRGAYDKFPDFYRVVI